MRKLLPLLAASLLLGLAACSDNGGEQKSSAPAATETKPATETAAPEAKPAAPAAETKAPEAPKQPVKSTEDITNEACLAAVSNQTGEGDVAVLSNEFSEANTLVMVGVGADRAPWKCLVSNDGNVQEVMFTGNDGDGAAQQSAPAGQPAAASGSDVSQAAIDACLAAVSNQTGQGEVAVLSTEFSEANSLVMVGVGADRAPWKCLVSNDGQVQEVMSMVNEGSN